MKSPIEVLSELTLAGKSDNGISRKHGVKILVKEIIKKSSNEKTHESNLESNEKKQEEPSRLVAVIVVRAWKGCVKYIRIKPSKKSGNRKEREKSRTLYILKPRRTLSIIIVGRRDIASLINSMVVTYLRPASSENILCIDEDSETTVDKNKNHSNRLKPISNKLI